MCVWGGMGDRGPSVCVWGEGWVTEGPLCVCGGCYCYHHLDYGTLQDATDPLHPIKEESSAMVERY